MKCVTAYRPPVSATFWVLVYLLTLCVVILGVLIIYDLLATDFELVPTVYVFIVLGMFLAFIWFTWRRGLFLGEDFRALIHEMGGVVGDQQGVIRGDFGHFVVDATIGRYLRGAAPFPSWHRASIKERPCGDPECMLCDSRFVLRMAKHSSRGREDMSRNREIIGGTWEGMSLRVRLERAISEAASKRESVSQNRID